MSKYEPFISLSFLSFQSMLQNTIPDTARPLSGTDTVQQTFCLPETFVIQFGDICKC